jgi:iron complex transport system substrate-binding protein
MPPSEYLAAIRMKKAESLLSDTALPVREVAAACGFENEYYFSNFFKRHKGHSPSAFRKTVT